jgi:hypothetical protein
MYVPWYPQGPHPWAVRSHSRLPARSPNKNKYGSSEAIPPDLHSCCGYGGIDYRILTQKASALKRMQARFTDHLGHLDPKQIDAQTFYLMSKPFTFQTSVSRTSGADQSMNVPSVYSPSHSCSPRTRSGPGPCIPVSPVHCSVEGLRHSSQNDLLQPERSHSLTMYRRTLRKR